MLHQFASQREYLDRLRSACGPLLVEFWHPRAGLYPNVSAGFASTWQGATRRIAIPAIGGGVSVAADGSNFRGLALPQSAITGTRAFKGTGLGTLVASGGRPCAASVYRYRNVTGTFPCTYDYGEGTNSRHNLVINGTSYRAFQDPNVANSAGGTVNTNVHFAATWADGTNVNIYLDGAVASAASTASLANNLTAIAFGTDLGAGNLTISNVTHGFHVLWSAFPGLAVLELVRSLLRTEYTF